MRFQTGLAFTLAAATLIGCGSDRVAGPTDEANRAAAALERAAGEAGIGVDPSSALTYLTVAAALRAGAPLREVEISVDGAPPEKWYAFGHESRFDPPTGASPVDLFGESSLRALLAWRTAGSQVHVVHLLSSGNQGPIGPLFPIPELDGTQLGLASSLIYSEGRNLFWEAARGTQTSAIVSESQTPCPSRRPAAAPAGPSCVLASFSFGFSGVEVEPASLLFGPGGPGPSAAAGTRRLSMAPQQVDGMVMTIDFRTLGTGE